MFCKNNLLSINIKKIIVILLILFGVSVRAYKFGEIPNGINQDEALAGYEAFSILKTGKDSFGYSFPVYLTAWGSGMNVLETYLMIPFIFFFGLNTFSIRLPQVILSIISLFIVFKFMKKILGENVAIISLALLVVSPWNIMMSRWGLESNLAPHLLLIATYYFIEAFNKKGLFVVSFIFYGLAMYSYAVTWLIIPLYLISFSFIHLFFKYDYKKFPLYSLLVLITFALPLMLFLLVNKGYISEIKSFISIPKMLVYRGSEISLSEIGLNIKNFINILITGQDGEITNSFMNYGVLDKFTLCMFLVGAVSAIVNLVVGKNRYGHSILLVFFLCPLILVATIKTNINRINSIWIPMLCVASLGIYAIFELLKKVKLSYVYLVLLLVFYSITTGNFIKDYYIEYNNTSSYAFSNGLKESLDFANKINNSSTLYISKDEIYSRILFYEAVDPLAYLETVTFTNYPAAYLRTRSFDRYVFDFNIEDCSDDKIYILNQVIL